MGREITISNLSRTRKFGVGYSFTPTGNDGVSIKTPGTPDYIGTLKQCCQEMDGDRTYQSHRHSSFNNVAWFYEGKRITHTWGGYINDDDEFVPGWMCGFMPECEYGNVIKIKVAD